MNKTVMPETRFDLEERTYAFARDVAWFCRSLPKTIPTVEYHKQVIRSSASVGSNYIEANESLGKKDFVFRLRICRKEAKESIFWLRLLIDTNDTERQRQGQKLLNEATELKKILSAIITKVSAANLKHQA